MGKLNLSVLILFVLLIFPASATVTTLGTFVLDTDIELPQVANATFCNLTSLKYPNSSIFLRNVAMEKDGTDFNFNLSSNFTSTRGVYLVNGVCDTTVFVYDFEVNPTGTLLTTGQGLLYLLFLFSAVLLFSFCLYWIFNLPGGNQTTPLGEIVSINDLKYLKLFLVPISYVLLMWIFGILRSITANFLIVAGPERLFNWAYVILLGLSYPLVIVGLWFLFLMIITDRKIIESLKTGRPYVDDKRR